MLSALARVHLFDEDGNEFEGHEYEPHVLNPDEWNLDTGVYGDPEVGAKFIFQAGPTQYVHGYYLTGNDGTMILMEDLAEPFEVTHMGTVLNVRLVFPLKFAAQPMTEQ
jgi:hypothetical protein